MANNNPENSNEQELNPREELLEAVKTADEVRLQRAIQTSSSELDIVFGHPHYCALVHIAAQNNSPEILKILLEAGADPNIKDRKRKSTPLHIAIEKLNFEIVSLLLQNKAHANVLEEEFSRSPLHIVALNWKNSENDAKKILDTLLNTQGIRIDVKDSKKSTPLSYAAVEGFEYMVKTLIIKGCSLENEVGNKILKDFINSKFPNMIPSIDMSKVEKLPTYHEDILYEAMTENNINLFQSSLEEIQNDPQMDLKKILEKDRGEYSSLLSYACDHGLEEFARKLLEKGADITGSDLSLTPILYAAKNGYFEVINVLIEHAKKLRLIKKILEAKDANGETVLHKVVKRDRIINKEEVNYYKCLEKLLEYKEILDINARDNFGSTPMHFAVHSDDQSFVKLLLMHGAHPGIKNKFNLRAITRIQPQILEEVLNDCVCKSNKNNGINDTNFEIILRYGMLAPSKSTRENEPETDCLRSLGRSKPHVHLLRHPIIDTFLFLKWKRISPYYYFNLFFYLFFVLLLTTYILTFYGHVKKEDETVIINNNVTSFNLRLFLQIIILMICIVLAILELINLLVAGMAYIKNWQKWFDLSIITMTIVLLFFPINYISAQGLSAWLILFSWIALLLNLGRHPRFAVYITMFKTVTYNFIRFIMMFSLMIIAFSLSFYLVFQIDEHFLSYPKTFLKSISMSTGELEYTALPLNDFPIASHFLFLIFVFLIVLVLMNLLNGLAVSDIQLIQQEAELVSYKSRVELISYIESILLANPFQNGNNRAKCCSQLYNEFRHLPIKILNTLGRQTLMFHKCLESKEIKLYPNKKVKCDICKCHKFTLTESHIEAAKTIVLSKDNQIADRLDGLEKSIKELTNIIEGKIKVYPAGRLNSSNKSPKSPQSKVSID